MDIKTLGVDLGKHGVHIFGQDTAGRKVVGKRLTNTQFSAYLAQLNVEQIWGQ